MTTTTSAPSAASRLPPPVTTILGEAKLDALRRGYAAAPAALASSAEQAFGAMYSPGSVVFNAFVDHFFTHGDDAPPVSTLSPRDRERSIIAIMAAMNVSNALAIHMYWGLGEGVTVAEIAEILLLVGGYAGTACYTNGLSLLSKTLVSLGGLLPGEPPYAPVDPLVALRALTG